MKAISLVCSLFYRLIRYVVICWVFLIFVLLPFVTTPGSDHLWTSLFWFLVFIVVMVFFVLKDIAWFSRRVGYD